VTGEGGNIGVYGFANAIGNYSRFGLAGYGANGEYNYGVSAEALGGINAYGIYALGSGGSGSNWSGYFVGDVYAASYYEASDRKLKNDIMPLGDALTIINQLKPSLYSYKTIEYKQMHLPEGLHYGLIADEVQQVMPGAVKNAVHPAQYENHDERDGKKLSNEVEFNAVNYTEMIPILIAAMKEQQLQIEELKKLVAALAVRK
jgi:hypothetical protein